MIRFILGLIVVIALIVGGSMWLWNSVWDYDVKQTNDYCHSLNAEPVFTHNTHAVCVTADGRVVGSI